MTVSTSAFDLTLWARDSSVGLGVPDRVMDLMAGLEEFIHADTPEIPFLVKAGLVYVQFETIHPSSMATAVWAGCSSPSCYAHTAF